MDREAVVIREEMSQTRARLDSKIARLEARAREYSPRRLQERYTPDYLAERVIGTVLTLVGLRMAWSVYRKRRHRAVLNAHLARHEHW